MSSIMSTESAWLDQEWEEIRQLRQKITETRQALGLASDAPSQSEREIEFLESWNRLLPDADAVSIGLWGTALVRACLDADDRFLLLKDAAPFAVLPVTREQIHTLRIQSEQDAIQAQRQQTNSAPVTLQDIYARLGSELDLGPEQIAACLEAELNLERNLARPLPPILQLIQAAHAQNKIILLADESPLDHAFLLELLQRAGYPIESKHLFTTSDLRVNSGINGLLRKAAKTLGLAPKKILHLSCDPEADTPAARQSDTPSLIHPYPAFPFHHTRHQSLEVRHIESLLHGTAQAIPLPENENTFWFQLGAQTLGPLLASFTLWLASQWREHHIQHAYFLGRTGPLLNNLYQILRQYHPDLPTSSHLHASRRAYHLPSLGCQHAPDLCSLLAHHCPCTVGDLLDRLNLDSGQFTDVLVKAGFHSPQSLIEYGQHSIRLQRLFRNPDLLAALDERAQIERTHLLLYLKQQHLVTDRPAALVDLGWNNTVTKSFLAILHHEEIHHHLQGYHLLTLPSAQAPQQPHYLYHSYLTENGEPLSLSEPFRNGRALLHTLCASLQSPLRHFAPGESKIEPVWNRHPFTPEQTAQLFDLHRGILAYAQSLFENPLHLSVYDPVCIPPEIAAASTLPLLNSPTTEQARKLSSIPYYDGNANPRPLAAFPLENRAPLNPSALLDIYERTVWKEGLLHLDTPESWLLQHLVAG